MAVTAKYGTYTFSPVPQMGIRNETERLGSDGLGAGVAKTVVTLRGTLCGENHNDIQGQIWALEAAFKKHRQQLYWHDGTTVRINNVIAQPKGFDVTPDWQQYDAEYTVTFEYQILDETHNAPFSVSYRSYNFAPIPVMGREFETQRQSDQGAIEGRLVRVTLNGFFDEGSESLNRAQIDALEDAMTEDGTLVYGGFTQAVRVERFSYPPVVGDRRVPWTCVFAYDDGIGGDGIVRMQSTRRITRVTDRPRFHKVPYRDGSSYQNLAETDQSITATGYVIGLTMAEARAAADAEIDAQFPDDGIEIEGNTITENANEKRVEWNVTKQYLSPVLRGGVYGKE